MDDRETILDALARICGAFSAVVREPGQRSIYGTDPTNCIAYREALAILGRDLEKAHPAAADVVREDRSAAHRCIDARNEPTNDPDNCEVVNCPLRKSGT